MTQIAKLLGQDGAKPHQYPQDGRGAGQGGALGRFMARWGRWSLSYYLLHQPVLMGLVGLSVMLRRG